MTDISQSDIIAKAKGGGFKASVGATYLELCQHITPPLAGYLNMHYPILGTDLSFEIVVLAETALAWILVKFTPQHFSDSVTATILWTVAQVKRWSNALKGIAS